MLKKFSKVAFWVIVYLASIGFILPGLFSAQSNVALALGIILVLGLIYRTITFVNWDKVKEFFKNY